MEPPTIREARLDDAGPLARLAVQLGYPCSVEAVELRMGRYLGNNDERIIVAELDGSVVGWTSIALVDHFYTPLYAEISGLIVDEKRRGYGIGALLLEEAKAWAKARGVDTLRLRANALRKDAHRFYIREGFIKSKEQFVFDMSVGPAAR
jgi:GNAT superfamily N-acetyltransferase